VTVCTVALAAASIFVAFGVGSAGARPASGSAADGAFLALDARTQSDVWAAGWQASGDLILPLVRHFDGTAWHEVTVPTGLGEAQIKGVAALGRSNVWFVGELWNKDVAFALHWDGSGLAVVSVPRPGLASSLNGVSASPDGDVWAVGDYTDDAVRHKIRSLVEHWTGSAWEVVPSPNLEGPWYKELTAVRAFGPGDVWAVGWSDYQPLVMRWNGSEWAFDGSAGGQEYDMFNAIAALSSDDLDAIGAQHDFVARHWDGSNWSGVATQGPFLFGASELQNGDVWAVGTDFAKSLTKAILIHGNSWEATRTPSPGEEPYGNILFAVDALDSSHVWAAGSGDSPLILRWTGTRWKIVYGPKPTPTPTSSG
jgi:hypothetical protein